MPKPAGHAVSLHGGADGFTDDQAYQGTSYTIGIATNVHDEIRLCSSHSLFDRRTELG